MPVTKGFHPVADLLPLLRDNGLLEPIVLDPEGRTLDGRNRYRACFQAGVEPRFVPWTGQGSPAAAALSLDLHRRLARLLEAEAVQRRGRRAELVADLPPISPPGARRRSSGEAVGQVNVSPRLVASARKVLRDGCDELIAAVESGDVAVTPAAALAALPKEKQSQILAAGPAAAAAPLRLRDLRGFRRPPRRKCPPWHRLALGHHRRPGGGGRGAPGARPPLCRLKLGLFGTGVVCGAGTRAGRVPTPRDAAFPRRNWVCLVLTWCPLRPLRPLR